MWCAGSAGWYGWSALEPLPLRWRGVIEEYREHLPVTRPHPWSPFSKAALHCFRRHGSLNGPGRKVWLKLEGANPTGSFKDRGMTVAISKAMEEGAKAVVCGSTGNTSASAAAYAARAGLTCVVLIPDGYIALGQTGSGAGTWRKSRPGTGEFRRAPCDLVRRAGGDRASHGRKLHKPHRIEGQKTGAFEVVDVLGDAPDVHCMPVGNAGNITAYWKGYREYQDAGRVRSLPRMFGFQAAGAAPIVLGHPVERPETIATAIRIGKPASWYGASAAASESGGLIEAVDDDDILGAYRFLAREESVFCEPASAASVAGLLKVGVPAGVSGMRPHRPWFEGPGCCHRPDSGAQGSGRRPGGGPGGAGPVRVPGVRLAQAVIWLQPRSVDSHEQGPSSGAGTSRAY